MIAPDPLIAGDPSQIPELDFAAASEILRALLRSALPLRTESPYHSLQEALYAVRTTAGFSLVDLAARLGITAQAVSTVECGSTSFSATILERLSKLAGYYSLPRAAEYLGRLASAERHRSYQKGGKR